MNMVRIGGTMVYEADDFHALCDELGLLVWQDAMLANFDYPTTEAFRASLAAELTQFLDRTQSNPSLAVVCGGSEVLQQSAMLGVPADKVDASLYTEFIPDIVKRLRPDVDLRAQLAFGRRTPVPAGCGRGALLRRRRLSAAVGRCTACRCALRLGMPGAGECPVRASHGNA